MIMSANDGSTITGTGIVGLISLNRTHDDQQLNNLIASYRSVSTPIYRSR